MGVHNGSGEVEFGSVRRSLLLGALPFEDLSAVLDQCRSVRIGRGAQLLRAGDDNAAVLLRGVVSTPISTPSGGTLINSLLGAGSCCGLISTLGHPRSGTDVTAISDVEALVISGGSLRKSLRDRPAVARACLQAVTAELAAAREEAVLFAGFSAGQRVVHRLLELLDRFGGRLGDDGSVRLSVPLTQEELASWSHASRESTAKVLHELRLAGVLRTGRRELTVVDLPQLKRRRDRTSKDQVIQDLLRRADGKRTIADAATTGNGRLERPEAAWEKPDR